ncbi:hypothetical protein P5G65_36225 [Paenibacillus chondroitinus]|uniref:Uncharacterized protein n=1 Tax=Paenibacillus chondroitinus TaxID=59842 RepID=A0ABU6DPS8_9BACL|nr:MULTISPECIES: hypothetical protein [Paenibacillus]MCY9656369.1 hypothetical protein [Paenibacillus anseongense]MEB4799312.1 hypothetical protein [Paenibacillus chondroitinus]
MKPTSHETAIQYLKTSSFSERDLRFREAINDLNYHFIKTNDVQVLKDIYFKLKDITLRNIILGILMHNEIGLKQFFLDVYKKERYLDMKLKAIRGLANYTTETEIEQIMENFLKLLMKRPENTPYNYQEYEFIRSACGLPYLIKKYGYSCFEKALRQEEKQYNEMPEAFKGHYSFDEDGNLIVLRNPNEAKEMMNNFFASKNSRN